MSRSPFHIAALALFAALLASNIYRAATQSIVHDEALTWVEYLAGPTSDIFQHYDANNHFLATILFKISVTLFGDSEFALRLPTLFAGAWFFWTIFGLSGLLFGDGWLFLLACAALTLNPILLDFLVAARGYGLAMAGLFWGFYQIMSWLDERSHGVPEHQLHRRLWKAALGFSVAVAANLTFLMPVLIMASAFCVLLLRKREKTNPSEAPAPSSTRKKNKKAKSKAPIEAAHPYDSFLHFVVPIILAAIAFLIAAPIDTAHTRDFYAGKSKVVTSWQGLIQVSFAYGDAAALQRVERIWAGFALYFFPAIVFTALIVAFMRARMDRSALGLAVLFSSLAVAGSATLLVAAHLAVDIPYPEDRTGIYFVPLATLAALGLAKLFLEQPGPPGWVGSAVAVVLLSFTLEFAAQWNVKSFWVWRYDADSKRIFEKLEEIEKPATLGPEEIRLGASWVYDPSLNFYRVIHKIVWMAPLVRDGFGGQRQFYVVSPEEQHLATLPRMKPVYQGPISGTILAIPQ
jgi:hypothetical protein